MATQLNPGYFSLWKSFKAHLFTMRTGLLGGRYLAAVSALGRGSLALAKALLLWVSVCPRKYRSIMALLLLFYKLASMLSPRLTRGLTDGYRYISLSSILPLCSIEDESFFFFFNAKYFATFLATFYGFLCTKQYKIWFLQWVIGLHNLASLQKYFSSSYASSSSPSSLCLKAFDRAVPSCIKYIPPPHPNQLLFLQYIWCWG